MSQRDQISNDRNSIQTSLFKKKCLSSDGGGSIHILRHFSIFWFQRSVLALFSGGLFLWVDKDGHSGPMSLPLMILWERTLTLNEATGIKEPFSDPVIVAK